jgi:hypothetical protein
MRDLAPQEDWRHTANDNDIHFPHKAKAARPALRVTAM